MGPLPWLDSHLWGRLRWRREEAPTCLPILPSQRAVTSLRDGSVHSLTFSAPLSLSPPPFSLHKRLPATYWGSSPLLVWKAKTNKKPLILPELNLFMRNQPRFLPLETLTFQGCTCNSWHQNTAWDLERRSRGSSRLQGPGWEEALLPWRRGAAPVTGSPGHQSRTEGPANVRGNSGVCQSGCRKGYAPLFTWKQWSLKALKPRLTHILW